MNENLQNIPKKLNNLEFIERIASLVQAEATGSISICLPTLENQKNKIHFLIDTEKKINLFKSSALAVKIKEALNYYDPIDAEDEYVVILNKSLFTEDKINKLFKDMTKLAKENFSDIQSKFHSKKLPRTI